MRADEAGAAGDEHAHGGRLAVQPCQDVGSRSPASRQARRPSRQCGQLGRALLAAQHRVRRPRRAGAELGGRDPAHAAVEARLLEDRLGEVGPRAVALRGDVVDAVAAARALASSPRRGGRRRSGEPRWSSTTATSSRSAPSRSIVRTKLCAGRAEEPRGADDPRLLARRRLAVQLRAPVGAERRRRVRLDVRLALRPVEDVVGRPGDERRAERRRVLRRRRR